MFLGFANFYQCFISHYLAIARPLINVLKGQGDKKSSSSFQWGTEQQQAFDELKTTFTSTPMLIHFDLDKAIRIEIDALGFAIVGILSQPMTRQEGSWTITTWHPVAFFSKKMDPAECNYETHDQELLAIVKTFNYQYYYLEGSKYPITILTNYNNLKYFITIKLIIKNYQQLSRPLTISTITQKEVSTLFFIIIIFLH